MLTTSAEKSPTTTVTIRMAHGRRAAHTQHGNDSQCSCQATTIFASNRRAIQIVA